MAHAAPAAAPGAFRRWLEARKMTALDVPIWLIGLLVAAMWSAPFVWMVSTSLKYPSDVMTLDIEWFPHRVTLGSYIKIFAEYPVLRWGLNSVIQAVTSTALSVLFGSMEIG